MGTKDDRFPIISFVKKIVTENKDKVCASSRGHTLFNK